MCKKCLEEGFLFRSSKEPDTEVRVKSTEDAPMILTEPSFFGELFVTKEPVSRHTGVGATFLAKESDSSQLLTVVYMPPHWQHLLPNGRWFSLRVIRVNDRTRVKWVEAGQKINAPA